MLEAYPDIMSIADIRDALGIGRTKAYELVNTGQIKSIRIGNTIRIPKQSLLAFIEAAEYNHRRMSGCRADKGGA